jgi:glyoxylase-like metal-dependent hydrolase (beta-lactamase superfamily II)
MPISRLPISRPPISRLSISRRGVLGIGLGLGAGLALPTLAQGTGPAEQEAEAGAAMNGNGSGSAEGFFRAAIGDAEVIAVTDGAVRRPLDDGFVRNAPLEAVQAALAAAGLPTDHILNPFTPFVVVAENRRFLLDAGFADNGPEGTGLLHANMAKAGLDPAAIDVVLMSHLHGDHVNGLRRRDGSLVYPGATLYVPRPEYEHWMDEARMAALPEAQQGGFRAVQRVLADYPEDRLTLFEPGERLEDRFESVASFGHSPGHTAFVMGEGEASFTYLGDVALFPALFVRNPDWSVQFDADPEAARAVRHAMLGQAAESGGLVGGYHFPLPSFGRIAAEGDGYALLPAG